MSTEPTTIEHVRALALAVRDGELTPEQREHLIDLLHTLNTAVRLVPQAQETYPDNDAAALGYVSAMWEPAATRVHPAGRDCAPERRGARGVACTHLLAEVYAPGHRQGVSGKERAVLDAEEERTEEERAEEARTIGARARIIRRRRGLSLEVVAGLAGITAQYLSMLERGLRGFNRRGLIEDLAAALSCAVADLIGRPYLQDDRDTAAALATVPDISLAINDCTLDDVPDLPARPVEELVVAAADANAHLDAARFSLAGRDLGSVLNELHIRAVTGNGDSRRAALAALTEACLVGASVARHFGYADLAVATARRGCEAARRLGDSTRTGLLTMHTSLGLAWIGARHRVTAVLDEALAETTPDPSAADTGPAEAAGMMHLTAAMHHARQGRASNADDHLLHAQELARHTGERNALLQHFGPVNVSTWGVNVAVELGRGPAVAERVEPNVPRLLATFGSAVRGGALHFDLARAYTQAEGARDAEAIRHMDAADRLAPQYVRPDPFARDLVEILDRRAKRRVWELDSLCNRFGIRRPRI